MLRRLSDAEVVRVLELTAVIANLQPRCSMALLPVDARDQAIADGWRRALLSCPRTLTELARILNRD
jgi:hypothetical protein